MQGFIAGGGEREEGGVGQRSGMVKSGLQLALVPMGDALPFTLESGPYKLLPKAQCREGSRAPPIGEQIL